MTRVAAGRTRSTRPACASMRRAASSGSVPRPARRSTWTAGSQVTSQTSSQTVASPPSTSWIASMTTPVAPSDSAASIAPRIRARPAGPVIASRSRQRRWHRRRRSDRARARSSVPSSASASGPNRSTIASSVGSPGSTTLARDDVRVDHDDARPLAEPAGDRRLAAADRPGDPDPDRHGARSSSSSQASSAAARAASMSASSLVTRRSSTKLAATRRVAHRELEVVLAQPEPGQLGVERRPSACDRRPSRASRASRPRGSRRRRRAAAGRGRSSTRRRGRRPAPTGPPRPPSLPASRAAVQPLRLRLERARDGPAAGDRGPPRAIAAVERRRRARRRRPTASRRRSRAAAGRARRPAAWPASRP